MQTAFESSQPWAYLFLQGVLLCLSHKRGIHGGGHGRV